MYSQETTLHLELIM